MASLFPSSISSAPNQRRGLLGFGGIMGGQPPAGLLGRYYDPAEERRRKIFGAMSQAGLELLRNGRGNFGEVLGQGLAGAVQGANNAGQDYRQDAMGYQQVAQQEADRQRQIENDQFNRGRLIKQDAWANTEHQNTLDDRASAEKLKTDQHAAIMEWAHKKDAEHPGFLQWADQFPEEAAKAYSSEMMPVDTSKPTGDIQEYNYAVQQGFKGTFQQYMIEMKKAGASSVNVNPPIPAEIGARIGLGERFLSTDFDDTISKIQSGEATGAFDYLKGSFGRGDAGEVQRRMATGVDSLRRNLTGAGISATEAGDYSKRYQPVWSDDADTLERKARGLKADLEAVAQGALAGKAGNLQSLLHGQEGWGVTIDESMKNHTKPLEYKWTPDKGLHQ